MTDTSTDADGGAESSEAGVFAGIEEGATRVTGARTITEADIVNFAGVSGDFNHVHTDKERMADSHYGEPIAHGMLVLSIATGLIWQDRSAEYRDSVVAFYGMDRLRFRAPTFVGDTVHVESEVTETTPRPDGPGNGTVRYDVDIKNQDDEVLISFEMISLLE
jgi:acyl dehydratase